MTPDQQQELNVILTEIMQDFMHENDLPIKGVHIKTYSSPTSFTVVINSEE